MADISKIQVGSTTYDVTDKAQHSGLTTSAKTYVGGINELDSTKIDKASQATKTSDMTAAVGIDSDGKLWSLPGGGSSTDEITNDSGVQGATATDALNALSATIGDKADKSKIKYITLSSTWTGSASPYSQTVTISGYTVTANTKVDLQPAAAVIQQLIDDGVLGLYIINNNGTLTAYAIGAKPTASLTIQATLSEVTV